MPQETRKTLVLDLDETLVRCTTRKSSCTELPPSHDAKTKVLSPPHFNNYNYFNYFRSIFTELVTIFLFPSVLISKISLNKFLLHSTSLYSRQQRNNTQMLSLLLLTPKINTLTGQDFTAIRADEMEQRIYASFRTILHQSSSSTTLPTRSRSKSGTVCSLRRTLARGTIAQTLHSLPFSHSSPSSHALTMFARRSNGMAVVHNSLDRSSTSAEKSFFLPQNTFYNLYCSGLFVLLARFS